MSKSECPIDNHERYVSGIVGSAKQAYLDRPNDAWDVRKQLATDLAEYPAYASATERNPDTGAWMIARAMRDTVTGSLAHLTDCELQNLLLKDYTPVATSATRQYLPPEIKKSFSPFSNEALTYMHTAYALLGAAAQRVQQRMHSSEDPLYAHRDLLEIVHLDYQQLVKTKQKLGWTNLHTKTRGGINLIRADNSKVSLELLTKFALFESITGPSDSSSDHLVAQALRDADTIGSLSALHKKDGLQSFHRNRLSERLYPNPDQAFNLTEALPLHSRDSNGKLQLLLSSSRGMPINPKGIEDVGNCPVYAPTTTPQHLSREEAYNFHFAEHVNHLADAPVIDQPRAFSAATNLIRFGALIGKHSILTDSIWSRYS